MYGGVPPVIIKLGLPPETPLTTALEGEIVSGCAAVPVTLTVDDACEPRASTTVTVTDSVGVLVGTDKENVPPLLRTVDGLTVTEASLVVTA